jgi:hypothetical protein
MNLHRAEQLAREILRATEVLNVDFCAVSPIPSSD